MSVDIAFLHTSSVHVPTFERLLARVAPGVRAQHVVDEALLRDARAQGAGAADVVRRVQAAVQRAAGQGVRAVICTCSTIGGAAEQTPLGDGCLAARIDRAMADRAVTLSEVVLVVAALDSTLAPTVSLVKDSARRLGRGVVVRTLLAERAWDCFERGDMAAYAQAVAAAVHDAEPGHGVVVLAQASMEGAVAHLKDLGVEVLSSPELGLRSVLENVMQGHT